MKSKMLSRQLQERYQVVCKLGEGATSEVYLVWYERIRQWRAIKCIRKDAVNTGGLQEAEILKRLKHPAIPTIYEMEEDQEFYYLVMEYMQGKTFLEYYQKFHPIREKILLQLAIQLCEIVEYLHEQKCPILYSDFKPQNLMISEGRVRLIDFGAASFLVSSGEQEHYGTVGYAPPEAYGTEHNEERSDIYGIGTIIYYLMTGSAPGKTSAVLLQNQMRGYSQELQVITEKTLKHNVCERDTTVAQVRKRLEQLQGKMVEQEDQRGNHTVVIGIMSAQVHMGATHLALGMSNYLKRCRKAVLYVEQKEGTAAMQMMEQGSIYREGQIRKAKEKNAWYYWNHGIPITMEPWLEGQQTASFDYMVRDLGVWSAEMDPGREEAFLAADLSILVLGAKPWEWNRARECIKRWEGTQVCYVVNFCSVKQFRGFLPQSSKQEFFRVPYCPDPWEENKITEEFFSLLLQPWIKSKRGKGNQKR